MKRFLQTAALSLVLTLSMAFAMPALAAEQSGADAYVTVEVLAASYVEATANVNVRSGPGTGYTKLGVLARGTKVEKVGTSGSWTVINYNGKQAYVSSDYLKAVGSTGTTAATGKVTATANVNVRTGPGTGYSKLGVLAQGMTVEKYGTSGTWTIINFNGQKGYVSSTYLKAAGSSTGGSSSGGSTTDTGYVAATANVNVRSGPGTGYSIIGSLYKGTIVPRLGTSGSWTKISYNGGTGYVSSQYLTASSYSGGTNGSTGSGSSSQSGYDDAGAAQLISIINNYRSQSGIAKLTTTDALNKAAKIRVQEIVQKFDHERPDGTMVFTVDPEHINGENIAKGSGLPTAQSAADGFMNSQGHRENAMRTSFTKTGAACLRVDGVTYWVHLFGY